ncbi:MAG: CidA/LrgA family protein [Lachnospiraceae bacterium]|nr:CidA/LrgA family protein [Lachnospiraceae bacterium]
MKIIKQFGIIFAICWFSVVIEHFLPFSFPSSVIGMIVLLFCLLTGVLKVDHIREKSDFLLSNMAFFFIPAGVNVINYLDILKAHWLTLILICSLTTLITFAVTAYSVRLTMRLLKRERSARHE